MREERIDEGGKGKKQGKGRMRKGEVMGEEMRKMRKTRQGNEGRDGRGLYK